MVIPKQPCQRDHTNEATKNDNEYKEKEDFNLADLILEIVTRRATKQKVSTVALAQKRELLIWWQIEFRWRDGWMRTSVHGSDPSLKNSLHAATMCNALGTIDLAANRI